MGTCRHRIIDRYGETLDVALLTGEQALVDEMGNTLAEVHTVLVVSKVEVDTPENVVQVEFYLKVVVRGDLACHKQVGVSCEGRKQTRGERRIGQVDRGIGLAYRIEL
jgi:hypothetical protein